MAKHKKETERFAIVRVLVSDPMRSSDRRGFVFVELNKS